MFSCFHVNVLNHLSCCPQITSTHIVSLLVHVVFLCQIQFWDDNYDSRSSGAARPSVSPSVDVQSLLVTRSWRALTWHCGETASEIWAVILSLTTRGGPEQFRSRKGGKSNGLEKVSSLHLKKGSYEVLLHELNDNKISTYSTNCVCIFFF